MTGAEPGAGLPGSLVSPEARELVFGDRSAERPVDAIWERERNLERLDRECGSVPRLLAGIGTWLLALVGVAGVVVGAWSGASPPLRVAGLAAGLLVLAGAAWLGRQVWVAGQAVVDAFCWWQLLPQRVEGGLPPMLRESPLVDAVEARTFALRGRRMIRIGAASLSFLVPFVFLLFATEDSPRFDALWPAGQGGALLVAMLLLLVVSWTAGAVVGGGQWRANWANSQRDPVQSWIFATTGKLFRR